MQKNNMVVALTVLLVILHNEKLIYEFLWNSFGGIMLSIRVQPLTSLATDQNNNLVSGQMCRKA